MKARVSHLLKAIAIAFFIGGVISLFIPQPIRTSSHEQKELYASELYQMLAKQGVKARGWVVHTTKGKENAINLYAKFFDRQGLTNEIYIPLTKVEHREGDLIDILYNPNNPKQARLLPADESSLNWPLFGWCIAMGIILYFIGHLRYKVSGGIE